LPPSTSRPSNHTRSLFHVASGAVALGLIRFMPTRGWLVAVAAAFGLAAWSMEIARRRSEAINERLMRFFGPVAHPDERYRVNSSTWYVTALVLLASLAPAYAAEIGVLVLAVADPAAAFLGRRFGRVRLRNGRTLEGTLAFFAVGAIATFGWLSLTTLVALPTSTKLALAAAGAAAGAVTELGSSRVDDNFSIPIVVAASVATLGTGQFGMGP
jgi:dolichol kinase